jgi:hypothetical protein
MLPIPFINILEAPSAAATYSTVSIGYANCVDFHTSLYVGYYKFTVTNTSTTNVGIKVPIVNQGINVMCYGATSSATALNGSSGNEDNDLMVQDASSVGLTPSFQYYSGYDLDRGNWTVASDANYIYIYTSNALQKSGMTAGNTYWFGIKLKGPSQFLNAQQQINYVDLSDGSMNCRYEDYFYDHWVGTFSATVLDYNA